MKKILICTACVVALSSASALARTTTEKDATARAAAKPELIVQARQSAPQPGAGRAAADVLSLRGRYTDTMRDIPGIEYRPGEAYVGADKRYYRASGTSFSAPIVTGIVSLMLSKNPDLKPDEIKELLRHTARDVGVPGVDQHTGYGVVDAAAALRAKPGFFIRSAIDRVNVVRRDGGPAVEIIGTVEADRLAGASVFIGASEDPKKWKKVIASIKGPVKAGVLGAVKAAHFKGATVWMIRLVVRHKNGKTQQARFRLALG